MSFRDLLAQLERDFSDIRFAESEHFYWSPHDKTVYFNSSLTNEEVSVWTLLHETAHGLLNHFDFKSDFHLIKLESEAWDKTLLLCGEYGLSGPDSEYIQDCIDTYRNWQYRRSVCPSCSSGGCQIKPDIYLCLGCSNNWKVTKQRFCRSYRKNKTALI